MKKLLTSLIGAALACGSLIAADSVPWTFDFSGSISSWTKTTPYSSSRNFTTSNSMLYLSQAATNKYNDRYIFFTPDGFSLEAGKSYKFETDASSNFTAGTAGAEGYFEILLYKKGTSAPSHTNSYEKQILKVEEIPAGTPQTFAGYFEPEETGDYYLCLHAYATYAHRALYWDNFKLTEGSMDAPDKPSITITPDETGVLKAEVKVTAPDKIIRGTALDSMTKMVVYRDGGEIAVFENPTPGQVFTINDKVAQPGDHLYSALAYNDKGPGAQIDVTTVIGASVQARTWNCLATYLPDGTVRISWPEYNGAAGYKVKLTTGREVAGTPAYDEESKMYSLVDTAFDKGTEPNGWQYDVLCVAEDGTETHRYYSQYLCLNNEIPYYPVMNRANSLDAFTLDQNEQYGWQYYNLAGGHVGDNIGRDYNTKEMDWHWLISPGVKLSKDKFYRVKITACNQSGVLTYTVKAGMSNCKDSLNIVVTDKHPLVKAGYDYTDKAQTDEMFLSVPEDGQYFIGINGELTSENATGDYLRMKRFDIIEVDPTLPNAPTDLTVHYSTTGGSEGKISFKVPSVAINGDPVVGLTRIEVFKNGEAFLTITDSIAPGATLEFPVQVVAGQSDLYSIMAFNAAGQGESASTTVMVLSTPYLNDFSAANSLEGYTKINLLGTSNELEVFNGQGRLYSNDYGHDYWLITPPITLTKDMYYDLQFMVKSKDDKGETLDVMIGKAVNPELLDQRVMETITIDKGSNIFQGLKEEYFTVTENGQYFLGFHFKGAEGRGNNTEIYIDNINISSAIQGSQPDRGVLEVVPASDGSLKAKLVYTAATQSLNGTALNANSTQDVYFFMNGVQTPAGRTYKAYPGQQVAIDVEVPEDLPYIFSAKTGYQGRLSYKDAFIGINRPQYPDPDKIRLKETNPYGHVEISWEEVSTDVEGYPLYSDLLTYKVMRVDYRVYQGETYIEETLIGENIKGNSFEFDAVAPTAQQTTLRYAVQAFNPKGEGSSKVLTSYINVGRPYHMPYQESFAKNGNPGTSTAINYENQSMTNWGIMGDGYESGVNSADQDGYYLALESMFQGGTGTFSTGKVNLGTASRPSLTLMVYNHTNESRVDGNLLKFKVYTKSDNKWHDVSEATPINDLCNGKTGWNKVTVDLADFVDQVIICGIEVTCMTHTFTSLDNIRIWEAPEYDMTFQSHNAPMSVTPGKEFSVDVNFVNNGIHKEAPESIEMYVDGEKVKEVTAEAVDPEGVGTVTMSHSFPAVDMAISHSLQFNVVYANDHDTSDNMSAPHTLMLVDANLSPVENLKASVNNDHSVSINWDEPVMAEAGVRTETFEDWKAGEASQFGWTAFDADKLAIKGLNDGTGNPVVIPGLTAFEPASWAVIDNEKGNLPASAFPAKSGNKFLMSIVPVGDSGSADDWMITPELSGKAQTLKFWTNNYPRYRAGYEVLTSDGNMHMGSFKSNAVSAVNDDKWVEVSIDLPEGTKRAAIRNISYCEDSFMLMVDDVTFEPAVAEIDDLKGYNVYREAELIGEIEATDKTYTTAGPLENGTYTFAVAAKYSHGESKVVPVKVIVDSSGISSAIAEGVHVFGGEGCIHITGAEGMNVAVYNLEGVMITAGEMGASERIAAASGLYVVSVDGKSYKVMVK